ncbi:hypothetical protein Taro_004538 [Colocasia esculenta]|uniref:Uncharacterized protein n=1 Tax=Colocasia esculenta TaxID=4460 RepID=A0A843TKB3_COLES|nr:hypothetical protein [Colocasia esculenta]
MIGVSANIPLVTSVESGYRIPPSPGFWPIFSWAEIATVGGMSDRAVAGGQCHRDAGSGRTTKHNFSVPLFAWRIALTLRLTRDWFNHALKNSKISSPQRARRRVHDLRHQTLITNGSCTGFLQILQKPTESIAHRHGCSLLPLQSSVRWPILRQQEQYGGSLG